MTDEWKIEPPDVAMARYEAEYQEMIGNARSAEESALELMCDLEDLWLSVAPGKTSDDFMKDVHRMFDYEDPDIEAMEAAYIETANTDERTLGAWPFIDTPIRIAYGHAYVASLAAIRTGATNMAFNEIQRASLWHGIAIGLSRTGARGTERPKSIADVARDAAIARNSENRAIKQSALDWLDEHFHECKSMDDAAARLTKIVPVVFRTARRYVTYWSLSRH
ncbi:hypothetical protein [Pandoraea terrigena]|uniref:Uncharacterized protein n=1 Tax=Pandoraea terrigena TaxID=2508292 RepID=A0A5E4UN84_9BURK|nr:hypothetical protein [Pandoraea terrigena]VVE01367.1 hypothetical protein PTE31013_02161 [Pandoraea terrigena]